MECCQNNIGKGLLWSRCLRPKGHAGICMHVEICNNLSCMCGGIFKRMEGIDLQQYNWIQDIKQRLSFQQDTIVERYKSLQD